MNKFLFLLLAIIAVVFLNCKPKSTLTPSSPKTNSERVAFYNVENLFDLIDDPNKRDEDFTPDGKQNWTAERKQTKLEKLNQVFEGMEYPSLIGLCEVENDNILTQLTELDIVKKQNYRFIHFESPDIRGIDVALLYKKGKFKPMNSKAIRIDIPSEIEKDYTTRDILYVKGNINKKTLLHIFINHWPSRRGGQEASEAKRVYVAQQLRKSIDSLYDINADANVIIMGDFNDEPDNKSITSVLKAVGPSSDSIPGALVNYAVPLDLENKGSYNYRGKWNMLDQIIVSTAVHKNMIKEKSQHIFDADWLMFDHNKYGKIPNRTYGGPNYYGGYSDHLAVYLELEIEK